MKVWHSRPSLAENPQPEKSKVYFIPKSKGLGIDGMGEVAVTFELFNQFLNEEGKSAPFNLISNAFELAFNFSFGV